MPRARAGARQRFRAAATLAPRYDDEPVIGLPPGAMVISNSDRKRAHCPRKWWWAQGVGIDQHKGRALRFGSAYDNAMGELLTWYRDNPSQRLLVECPEGLDVCPWCDGDGVVPVLDGSATCDRCDGEGLGIFAKLARQLALTPEVYEQDGGLAAELDRLRRALDGWLREYDASMAREYRVLAVQPMYAVPITSPSTGKVYRSKVPVIPTEYGWRLATGHDNPDDVQLVTLPWYQLVKLDAVVQLTSSGKLYTWETKTSGSPESFSEDLLLDTQLPGYTRALWYVTQAMGLHGGAEPGGWLWDVTSSQPQADPKVLKDGSLSMDSRQRVPSWTWAAECERRWPGMTRDKAEAEAERLERELERADAEYEARAEQAREAGRGKAGAPFRAARDRAKDAAKAAKDAAKAARNMADAFGMIAQARESVDPKLYVRRWGDFTPADLREYELELYADAQRISGWLRALPGTAQQLVQDNEAVALHWPRVPLCRMPGASCGYTGPCLCDSREARDTFDSRQPLRWYHADGLRALQDAGTNTDDTEVIL